MVRTRAKGLALCLRTGLQASRERRQVAAALSETGFQVREIADGEWQPDQENTLLVLENLNWFPKLRRQLLKGQRTPGSQVIVWHTEPLPPPKASGLRWPLPTLRETAKLALRDDRATDVYTNYFLLRALARRGQPDVLAVSTRGRVEFLREHLIPAHHVPLGYDESCGRELGLDRDIEVLFLGDLRISRRRRALKRLRKDGVNVTTAGDWFDPALWGDARTKLLNRTKIFLNIQRTRAEFAGLRFILGMANGALVVSEPAHDTHPFIEGRHFVSAPVEQMAGVIRYYLQNGEERRKITSEAYRFVTEELTMKSSAEKLAALISEIRPGEA